MEEMPIDLAEYLKGVGRHEEFEAKVVAYERTGNLPADAFNMALNKIAPEVFGKFKMDFGWEPPKDGVKRGRPRKAADIAMGKAVGDMVEDANFKMEEKAAKAEAKAAKKGESVAERGKKRIRNRKKIDAVTGYIVAKELFDGRDCPINDMVRWVTDNLYIDVIPNDAPSATAWTVLMLCRESKTFREQFLLKTTVELIKKSPEAPKADEVNWEGRKVFDLLASLNGGDAQ